MLIGQRTDVKVSLLSTLIELLTVLKVPPAMLSTNSSIGLKEFIEYLQSNGRLYQTDAIDYFIFNRGLQIEWARELPPYIVGGVVFGQ